MPTPDQYAEREIEPYTLELPDGRTVFFYDYDFTPGRVGGWTSPPEPAKVNVDQAWWADGFTFCEELDEIELTWLHEDDAAYDALVTFCENIEGEREHARLVAEGYEE